MQMYQLDETPAASGPVLLECDPQIVEAAVFALVRTGEHAAAYHIARERCYAIDDPDARDAAFADLHRAWFERLALARPVLEALAEYPAIAGRTARRILAPAIRRQDECAELFAASSGAGQPYLVIRLRADSFARPAHIAAVLRHELMHIHDMLDGAFAYDPSLDQFLDHDGVPTAIRDRYRVLWDVYIDGRLLRAGRIDAAVRDRRETQFAAAFPMLGAAGQTLFETLFAGRAWSHPELLAIARNPRANPRPGSAADIASSRA